MGEAPLKIKTERGDYRRFYANVRGSIEKKTPLAIPPDEILRSMRALLLAHKSSREKRTVMWNEEVE